MSDHSPTTPNPLRASLGRAADEPTRLWHELAHLAGLVRGIAALDRRQWSQGDVADRGPSAVWIFHGDSARFASGVFASSEQALPWVARHQVTGMLAEYPLGEGCYEAAVREGAVPGEPAPPRHTADHVAGFSPSGRHIHVRNRQPE